MGTNNQQQPMQRIVRPKVVLNNSNQQQQPPQPVPTRVRHTGFIAPSPAYTTDEESAMALTSQAAAVEQFKNDGRYTLVSSLPSNYYEYDFKELWIRPFTPNEARLLHMARVSGNLTYVISAPGREKGSAENLHPIKGMLSRRFIFRKMMVDLRQYIYMVNPLQQQQNLWLEQLPLETYSENLP